jgi:probable HAF family extracellular repeat protein
MNNSALSINDRGQIVGTSDLPGDTATHAVMWRDGKITDLGTLPGDYFSFAYGINDRGQVIAQSCDINFNCRAALWRNGVMTDLNALTPPGSLYLMVAQHINDRGEITGQGFDQNSGGTPAFLAVPCDEAHIDMGCQDAAQSTDGSDERPRVVLPESVRNRLRQRTFVGHY